MHRRGSFFTILIFLFLYLYSFHFRIDTSALSSPALRRVIEFSPDFSSQAVRARIIKILPSFNASHSPNPNWIPAIVLQDPEWRFTVLGQYTYYSLASGEFEVMVENVRQVLRYIEEWRCRKEGGLEDYINSRLHSGFLKIEGFSLEGKTLSFRLGGYADLSVNIETLSVEKIEGMVLIPLYNECLDLSRKVEPAYAEDEGAGMLMDVAMFWQAQQEKMWHDLMAAAGNKQLRFLRQGEELDFAIKLMEEEPFGPSAVSDISDSQWLGEYYPYDHPRSFFNLLNTLYYATFGANAFGTVDKEKTLEPACAKRSAEDFYQKLQALDSEGSLPQEIVIQEWGAGDGYSAGIFLERVKELDKENGGDYYSKITYILLDYSPGVVQDLGSAPHLAVHRDRIEVLQADALDPASLSGLKPALLIRANLLLNSLPIKIIEIRNGKVYEVEARTYIDMREDEMLEGYNFNEIKRAVQEGDVGLLRRLGKHFFQRVKYAEDLREIEDISSLSYAEYIRRLLDRGFEGRLSLDVGAMSCLENMLSLLIPGGIIQIADAGFTERDKLSRTAGMFRYFGAIYHPLNFDFLGEALPISLEVISQYRYAGEYAPRVLPANNLLIALEDFGRFRRYFNSGTIGIPGKLDELSQELMTKHAGLKPRGLREFARRISELGSTAFFPRHVFEWFETVGFITAEEYEILQRGDVQKDRDIQEAGLLEIYAKVCTQLGNIRVGAERAIETYEDALVYMFYLMVNKEAEEIRKDRYIAGRQDSHFRYILRVLGAEKALDAIWRELEYFYPGISIFNIQKLPS